MLIDLFASSTRRRVLLVSAALSVLVLAVGAGQAQAATRVHFVKNPTPVPILVYHHVQSYLAGMSVMYVGTSQFAGQLRYLHSHRYHPVTMSQVWAAWTGGPKLPKRPVVLTFDDGYIDQYRNAAPLLRRYHYPAVLNVVVYRGTSLTDAMIRRMVSWGWEIGSHTMTHPWLTHLSSASLRSQLVSSKRILERKFKTKVDFLCYPGGLYDGRVERAVRAAGYLAATSIRYGRAIPRSRWALPRIAAYWGESTSTFGRRLWAPRLVAPAAQHTLSVLEQLRP